MINTSKAWKDLILDLLKIRSPHKSKFRDEEFLDLEKIVLGLMPVSQRKFDSKIPILPKKIFYELTTSRNRNLISIDDQNTLRTSTVAFFGLSVGYSAVINWTLISRTDKIIIVDPDTISATNLNRLPLGWDTLGKYKTDIVEEKIRTLNPYCQIVKQNVVSHKQITNLLNSHKIDLIVDEIDDLSGKYLLRKIANQKNIPLISAADVGDNVALDIERYDVSEKPIAFLGRIPNIEKIDFNSISPSQKRDLIIKLVGFEENSERMLNSLMAIGGTIPTWPQLGSTASISGGVVASTIKKIFLGENIVSGRYYISLDSILDQSYSDPKNVQRREEKIQTIKYVMNKK